jgi:hypothetical protein
MTDEKLELHKRLQKFYKKKMGEVVPTDKMEFAGMVFTVTRIEKDTVWIICCNAHYEVHKNRIGVNVNRVPLPIDPVNPERGLWGMVCWKKWLQESTEVDGEILIFQRMSDGGKQFTSDPEEALLKALCEQEGL